MSEGVQFIGRAWQTDDVIYILFPVSHQPRKYSDCKRSTQDCLPCLHNTARDIALLYLDNEFW